MKTNQKGWIAAGIVALLVATVALRCLDVSNSDYRRHNRADAQQQKIKMVFNNTWTILKQQAGVTDQYRESFADIYTKVMDKRYSGGGGTLMKWVQEANPNFDPSLFNKLSDSIEIQQNRFNREQEVAADIAREDADAHSVFPGSMILGGRPLVKFQYVTSARTDEAFDSGQQNDIDLFDRKSGKDTSAPRSKQ